MRPFFRAQPVTEQKSDQSPVTQADRHAEDVMRAVLAHHFPDHGILGEEQAAVRPDAEWRWVLDPIDGTRAFITGRPSFGILLALLHQNRPMLGIIDQPITQERWIGISGQRTRFTGRFGGKAGARRCPALAEAELSCTSPDMLDDATRNVWDRLRGHVRRTSWGGDCYAYGLLALGQIDIIAEADLKPWDWAALVPVIEGAGGRITGWDGQALRMDGDGRVLAVGDPDRLADAVRALDGGSDAVVFAPSS